MNYNPHVKRCPECGGQMEIMLNLRGKYIRCAECEYENNIEWTCGGLKRIKRI